MLVIPFNGGVCHTLFLPDIENTHHMGVSLIVREIKIGQGYVEQSFFRIRRAQLLRDIMEIFRLFSI